MWFFKKTNSHIPLVVETTQCDCSAGLRKPACELSLVNASMGEAEEPSVVYKPLFLKTVFCIYSLHGGTDLNSGLPPSAPLPKPHPSGHSRAQWPVFLFLQPSGVPHPFWKRSSTHVPARLRVSLKEGTDFHINTLGPGPEASSQRAQPSPAPESWWLGGWKLCGVWTPLGTLSTSGC